MEQPSSSSKVTVEYFDPFNVYQLLSPGLLPRLPLRNLHWESHAGPLRSIDTLYIDLNPSDETRPASSASNTELSRVKSSDTASGDDGFRVQALGAGVQRSDSQTGFQRTAGISKGRRHQIPGLRQTPYLKIFFLRCDDNEIYKTQARKQVREWIKEHTPPAQNTTRINAQENHDAFEWLIVHVIVPNTAAATQPRSSSKGSSTLLEKLRADFNGGSKSSVDRIAQIRIGINDVPYEILPRVIPAIPGSYTESPKENEEAWVELIAKLKSLVLTSFDSRVSQYEDDIKEKDAQRALPGWNFCTFFVLKEGLARGFESVGLVEDALVGYDELAVGLDAIIREQSIAGSGAEHGGSFLPFTKELKLQLEKSKAAHLSEIGMNTEDTGPIDLQSTEGMQEQDEIPLSATKKNYRDLILANDISIFDFRCYIFARQLSLLLRMGNAWSSREDLLARLKELRESSLQGVAARQAPSQPTDDSEKLSVLGEICYRALAFITSISRIMQDDLLKSLESPKIETTQTTEEDPLVTRVVDNLVSSFTFSVAQQILAQTSTKSLPIPPSTLAPPNVQGQEQKASIPEPKTMMHPARSTSLLMGTSSVNQPPSPGFFPGGRSGVPDPETASKTSPFLKAGLEDLAAHRADLYLLSRGVLERLGGERGWPVGWHTVREIQGESGALDEVDLDNDQPSKTEIAQPLSHGITNPLLRAALSTQSDFYRLYETLTDKALRHYTVASHIQSVQTANADLAILKFHLHDYAAASSYFYRMTPFYGEGGWEEIEMCMLVMYTKCLKELKRNDEYVRVALKLLAKGAAREKDRLSRKSAFTAGPGSISGSAENISVDGYLNDVLAIAPTLPNEINVQLHGFFAAVEVEDSIRYHDEQDSFALQLRFKYLLTDELKVEKARVRIIPVVGGQGRDIWLETETPVVFKKGTMKVQVQSSVIIPGTYIVKQVILTSGNMILGHEAEITPKNQGVKFLKSPRLLLYQRPQAFDMKLSVSRSMHLSRSRTLEISLFSGWNDVQSGELHIRAATAGLRLQTSEAKIVDGTLDIGKRSEPGVIKFAELGVQEAAKIRIPFTIENDVGEISLKLEISYTTSEGTFFYASNPSMSIKLPLGVNVQDVFKHNALFSKFSISSSTTNPLRLLKSELGGSEIFEACKGGDFHNAVTIFPRQPAAVLYKITKKEPGNVEPPKLPVRGHRDTGTLSLVVHYICLEEEIDHTVSQALEKALTSTEFEQYNRLIIPTVLQQLHSRLGPNDFECAALLNEVSTSLIADMRWRDHFTGLGKSNTADQDVASSLAEWLRNWQSRTPIIPLLKIDMDEDSLSKARSITIPVEVPPISVVHTADLQLDSKTTLQNGEVVATTNQPLAATLKIKWTRSWDTKTTTADREKELEFVYEVSAPTDMWLIGGKRKGHFRTTNLNSGSVSFPILLIPVKEGYISYPSVEIKPTMHTISKTSEKLAAGPAASGAGKPGNKEETIAVTSETDYKNMGEAVRVISFARKTTVSLDASGPQGGAWLLESLRREEGVDSVLAS